MEYVSFKRKNSNKCLTEMNSERHLAEINQAQKDKYFVVTYIRCLKLGKFWRHTEEKWFYLGFRGKEGGWLLF